MGSGGLGIDIRVLGILCMKFDFKKIDKIDNNPWFRVKEMAKLPG